MEKVFSIFSKRDKSLSGPFIGRSGLVVGLNTEEATGVLVRGNGRLRLFEPNRCETVSWAEKSVSATVACCDEVSLVVGGFRDRNGGLFLLGGVLASCLDSNDGIACFLLENDDAVFKFGVELLCFDRTSVVETWRRRSEGGFRPLLCNNFLREGISSLSLGISGAKIVASLVSASIANSSTGNESLVSICECASTSVLGFGEVRLLGGRKVSPIFKQQPNTTKTIVTLRIISACKRKLCYQK